MPSGPLPPHYHALREQIEGILSEGKVHTRQATEWEKVETYWHIGDALQAHLKDGERAEYGQRVVGSLSRDLRLSESLLWDLILFRRSLPTPPTSGELGWSHFREVLHLPNQDQRRFYLRRAQEGRWSVRQLREAIRTDAYGQHTGQPLAVPADGGPEPGPPLQPRFGELHTYGIVEGIDPGPGEPELDLGFHLTGTFSALGISHPGPLTPGAIVAATRSSAGRYTLTPRPPRTRRYTYVAWVNRVIDGDTLLALVDLGFGLHTRPQRFRLRGIDCPELSTLAGRTARAFVEEQLAQVDFVVLATHRTDAYGRYLVDVRYLPGEPDPGVVKGRGQYLNRELLDERLARRYMR